MSIFQYLNRANNQEIKDNFPIYQRRLNIMNKLFVVKKERRVHFI